MALGDPFDLKWLGQSHADAMQVYRQAGVYGVYEAPTQEQMLKQVQEQALANARQAQTMSSLSPTMASRARELFLKRMGGIRAEMKVSMNDFVACHIHGDMVYLFYSFSGKKGVVEEQMDIFPSDTLISQFRMILS